MAERSRCGWAANGDGASANAVFPAIRCESTASGSTVPVCVFVRNICLYYRAHEALVEKLEFSCPCSIYDMFSRVTIILITKNQDTQPDKQILK